MECHRCGVGVRASQRFCDQCGASLKGVTDATEPLPRPPLYDFADDPDDLAEAAASHASGGDVLTAAQTAASAPTTAFTPPAVRRTDEDATTEVIRFAPPDPAATPTPTPAAVGPGDEEQTVEFPLVVLDVDQEDLVERRRFRIGPLLVLACVAAVGAAVAAVATVVTIDTDAVAPTFDTGSWSLADLGSDLSVALLVTSVALLVGGIAHGFRRRWGAGLAGGAGLALAGMAGLVVGLAEQPIQLAQTATTPAGAPPFTVSVTRDVGYVVLVAAALLGVVVFLVSLRRARPEPGGGLNPWIAALGALAAIVAAAGPLVPEGSATLSSNWSSGTWYVGDTLIDQPAAFFAGRLVQLGLLAGTGVVGFLLVRRYGLGLVVGGACAVTWLSIATLLELGDAPVGPAVVNPGSVEMDLHAVTIVGMVALIGLCVVAIIAAVDQYLRDR